MDDHVMVRSRILASAGLAVAAIGLFAGCSADGKKAADHTTAAPCALNGATTDAKASAGAPSTDSEKTPLLIDVRVSVDAACDAVDFTFREGTGTPAARIEYSATAPAGPSGIVKPVTGSAFLVVRFQPASGVDLNLPNAPQSYLGPLTITPSGLAHIRQVQQFEDFEGVLGWVIGLDSTRPFTLTTATSTTALLSVRIG